jgi:hypothetical protein
MLKTYVTGGSEIVFEGLPPLAPHSECTLDLTEEQERFFLVSGNLTLLGIAADESHADGSETLPEGPGDADAGDVTDTTAVADVVTEAVESHVEE